jgi:alpha-N-acetylglucosamine transferase
MMFAQLTELSTPADKVLVYPEDWNVADDSAVGRLLSKAKDEYNVQLNPVRTLVGQGQEQTWAESFTKLLVFNLTKWEKVVYMDNDGMILQVIVSCCHGSEAVH